MFGLCLRLGSKEYVSFPGHIASISFTPNKIQRKIKL